MKIVGKLLFMVFLVGLIVAIPLDARVRTKQSEREFDQQLSRSPFVVALFYSNIKNSHKSNVERERTDQLLRMYEKASSKRSYDDADVTFIKINVDARGSDAIARRYHVTQLPLIMLFRKGQLAIDQQGKNAFLAGFVSIQDVHGFIDHFWSNDISIAIQEREQKRHQRIQDSKDESDPYFYPAVVYTPSGDISSWVKPTRRDAVSD